MTERRIAVAMCDGHLQFGLDFAITDEPNISHQYTIRKFIKPDDAFWCMCGAPATWFIRRIPLEETAANRRIVKEHVQDEGHISHDVSRTVDELNLIASRGTKENPVWLHEVPLMGSMEWRRLDHGHTKHGGCIKNRFGPSCPRNAVVDSITTPKNIITPKGWIMESGPETP